MMVLAAVVSAASQTLRRERANVNFSSFCPILLNFLMTFGRIQPSFLLKKTARWLLLIFLHFIFLKLEIY